MMIPDSAWEPGGRIDRPQPFDAFQPGALSLASPLAIVRTPSLPRRRRRASVA